MNKGGRMTSCLFALIVDTVVLLLFTKFCPCRPIDGVLVPATYRTRWSCLSSLLVVLEVHGLSIMGRNYRSSGHREILTDCLLLAVESTGRELKIHHNWRPWACIVCRGAMPYNVYRRHHRICSVSCIHLIISWTRRSWKVHRACGSSVQRRRHRQHTSGRESVPLLPVPP